MSSAVAKEIEDYQTLSLAFQDILGVVITEEQRLSILAKLNRVMQAFELDSVIDLAEKLRRSNINRLNAAILSAITVGDTNWFRYSAISRLLQNYLLDNVVGETQIWVVGCGDGSLAYSVAIDIAEYNRNNYQQKSFSIMATDISDEILEQAENGCYPIRRMQGVPQDMLSMYFAKRDDLNDEFGEESGDVYQIKKKIRDRVKFSHCDLHEHCKRMGPINIIIAPEILVYFSPVDRARILNQFASQLSPSGILMVADDETINAADFEYVGHADGVFYRRKT